MAAGVGSMTFEEDLAADSLGTGQVDDIFGDDDIFNAPAPLPPLSPTNIDAVVVGGGDEAGEPSTDDVKKPKVIKRSPQPRLDEVRLCSDRGIPALANLCDGIKFKGKGHEASDLNALLQRFEHWAHRLYPKFPFQDCVDQIESMGNKKLVQNTIKAVRRGETGEADDDNSDEELVVNGDQDSVDAQSSMNNENFGEQIHMETSNTPVTQLDLTPEQQERIRLNRERALAKRKQQQLKLASQAETQSQTDENQLNSSSMPEEASQATLSTESQSPERSKLSFETDLEDICETRDVPEDLKNENTSRDDLEMTCETRNKIEEGKTTEDETMEINDDERSKNQTKSDCDNESMETETTLQDHNEAINQDERKTEKQDGALQAKNETNLVKNTKDKLLGTKTDDYNMDTESVGKSTELNIEGKIDNNTMET